MIKIYNLINILKKNSINFFTGVPDSVLKELSLYISSSKRNNHVIAVNEGSAVSIGIGYYLAKKKIPCIYMQNSGLSNAINPLISIADSKVYSIPLLLIIGWRGSPKFKDEPQHQTKGRITKKILELLKIKYVRVRNFKDLKKLNNLIKYSKKSKSPVACLIENKTLEGNIKKIQKFKSDKKKLNKEIFLLKLFEQVKTETRIISSTGYNSREILSIKQKKKYKKIKDFYMVGGMGHTSSVSLGFSLFTNKKTICIDGDGSLLMHMGSLKTLADNGKNNLIYILLNNNCHESVGGQDTYADNIDFLKFSEALGFKKFIQITNTKQLDVKLKKILSCKTSIFVEVKVSKSKKNNLPRPKNLIKIKENFIKK